MDEKVLGFLTDVKLAVEAIREFTADMTESGYEEDDLVRSAVERKYLIIGEALTRLRKTDPDVCQSIREHEKIIAFRNVLAHGYDEVDDKISWRIVQEKLPLLYEDVCVLLNQCEDRD